VGAVRTLLSGTDGAYGVAVAELPDLWADQVRERPWRVLWSTLVGLFGTREEALLAGVSAVVRMQGLQTTLCGAVQRDPEGSPSDLTSSDVE
jgi:hypothetical protein